MTALTTAAAETAARQASARSAQAFKEYLRVDSFDELGG
jgi:hypothetical protein